MAKVFEAKIVADTDEAISKIDAFEQRLENAGRRARRGARDTKKDWSSVSDLFGGVMPRNIQRLQRQFRSTNRTLGRVSKSFGILKKSIIATGIGALVVVVTELITNFEKYTDLLGITSEEQRKNAEAQKRMQSTMESLSRTTQAYSEVLADQNLSLEQRQAVLDQLSRTVASVKDIDLEAADAQERINAALRENTVLEEARLKRKEIQRQIDEKQAEIDNETSKWYEFGLSAQGKLDAIERRRQQTREDMKPLQEELNRLLTEEATAQADVNETIRDNQEEVARQAALNRQAEQERQRIQKAEEAAIAQNELLTAQKDMNDRERAFDDLRRKEERAKSEVESTEALLAIEETYRIQREELQAKYDAEDDRIADQKRQKDIDRITKESQDLARLEDELFEASITDQRELRELKAQQQFDDRMARAQGNYELEKQAEQLFLAEMEAIRDEANADELRNEEAKQAAKIDVVQRASRLVGILGDLAKEGSEEQKALAVTEVLLNQAVAISNAIAGATKAAQSTGPAAPFTQVAYIASMVGSVLTGFVSIKKILDEADAGGGSVGRGSAPRGGGNTFQQALVPQGVAANFDPQGNALSVRSYVVQSDIQGQQAEYERTRSRVVL